MRPASDNSLTTGSRNERREKEQHDERHRQQHIVFTEDAQQERCGGHEQG